MSINQPTGTTGRDRRARERADGDGTELRIGWRFTVGGGKSGEWFAWTAQVTRYGWVDLWRQGEPDIEPVYIGALAPDEIAELASESVRRINATQREPRENRADDYGARRTADAQLAEDRRKGIAALGVQG